ncbi:hypothetical protein GFS03_03605 [Sulfolobus sp. E5-1-F]|uniref:hypothetical protein n=1 Tax=Sulfolobaceae TaxID=118883 RepID=UPI00129682AC|nr:MULTISPECIES: hypothetical protein [unclassified Sulfolobus]QGA53741.1 hypothetical protein GFS03_03605 [Sulfolobus sp. E5-1-F]QGA68604.1 hypothetical protein GFS33_07615 [Sulfolobus sp. E11-6]
MSQFLQLILVGVFAVGYFDFLFMISNSMRKRVKLLREKLKVEFPLRFLQKSVDFLSSSEFAELMNELSIIMNISKINKNNLIKDFYSRSPKIEKELEDLLMLISIANKIDSLAKDMERKSTLVRVAAILILLDTIAVFVILNYYPSLNIMMYFILVGIMIGLLFIIFESLIVYYNSERYIKI